MVAAIYASLSTVGGQGNYKVSAVFYKVLHAPSSVGGNPQALSRAMRHLGVDSISLVVSQNYLSYPADLVLHRSNQSYLLRELKRLWAIFVLLPRFDIIHFNAGTTIASAYDFEFKKNSGLGGVLRLIYAAYLRWLQTVELLYIRALKKTVFITFQGDDARQGDFSLKKFEICIASQVDDEYYCRVSDDFKRRNIIRLCRVAKKVYALNPDLIHVLPKGSKFLPYSHIFMDEWLPCYSQSQNRPLRIVHAPSHRKVKGTELILLALRNLQSQGLRFELLLVEGLSNAEARKVYETADVLVDQLFAGWYGGLAVELMALGKPVLVYIREDDLRFVPKIMRDELPCIRVSPQTIESDLRNVIEMPREELTKIGHKSRAYVERWHDPIRIGSEIMRDYSQALSDSIERGA